MFLHSYSNHPAGLSFSTAGFATFVCINLSMSMLWLLGISQSWWINSFHFRWASVFSAPRPQSRRCWANPTSWDPLRVYLKRVDEDEKLKTELKAWETHSVLGVSGGIGIPFKKAAILDWRNTMKNGGSWVVSWIHRKILRLVWAVWDLLSRIVYWNLNLSLSLAK